MPGELWNGGILFVLVKEPSGSEAPISTERCLRYLGLEAGSSEVIETLGSVEDGDFKGDKKGSATC